MIRHSNARIAVQCVSEKNAPILKRIARNYNDRFW